MTQDLLLETPGPFVLDSDRTLLSLAGFLADTHGIPRQQAVDEIEAAYIRAAEAEYGPDYTFWVRVKPDGSIAVAQVLKIVEVMRDERREVALGDLSDSHPDARLGAFIVNPVAPVHPAHIAEWLQPRQTTLRNIRVAGR